VPAELTVISWRDIPAQVLARSGRSRARRQLDGRFQEAIDSAATVARLTGTDAYLGEWRRESRACGEDLEAEASSEAERLEREHPEDVLARLVRSGGFREAPA
jgi:Virulence factor